MFAFLLDLTAGQGEQASAAVATQPPANVVRLMFTALRPYVANWEDTGRALIQRVHREAVGGVPDVQTAQLLEEMLALPDVPSDWRRPDFSSTPSPLIPVMFEKDGVRACYFSLVTTVGTPHDITLQEIRLESFFPADAASEQVRW